MGENSAILYPKLLGALWLSFTHELQQIELKANPKNIMFWETSHQVSDPLFSDHRFVGTLIENPISGVFLSKNDC